MTKRCCPTCNQPLNENHSIVVDLGSNTINVPWSNQSVKLSPTMAELAFILAEKYPLLSTKERILVGLYGTNPERQPPYGKVRTTVAELRERVSQIDLDIQAVDRTGAYRMFRRVDSAAEGVKQ